MRKSLWTLAVDDFPAELTQRSFPLMERYARKIGAEFNVITERKWPDAPPTYEKLQVHTLGRDYAFNLFVDADALLHPDLPDLSRCVPRDHVFYYSVERADTRIFPYDAYFERDGRNLYGGGWMMAAWDWTHDFWQPLTDMTVDAAVQRLHPLAVEAAAGVTPAHQIDEFVTARNVARFGLKVITWSDILKPFGLTKETDIRLWHQCLLSRLDKLRDMDKVLKAWKI